MLNSLLLKFEPEELAALMKCSAPIAAETYRNVRSFCTEDARQAPALFAYCGTVFKAAAPGSFTEDEVSYAQAHLRILSGLYGVLCPLDLISPYRLEMKTMLEIPDNGKLSAFWKTRIAPVLSAEDSLSKKDSVIINLASGEYSRVVDKRLIGRRIINFHFKERTETGLKTVGMYVKTARGQMIRRIITEQLAKPELLKNGDTGGYGFDPQLSSEYDWVFTR